MPFSCEPFGFVLNTGLLHGPFLFQPVETELFPHREGRAPSLCGPLKKPRNTALTWFPKLLNRIRALPQNLALGMKTHTGSSAVAHLYSFLLRRRHGHLPARSHLHGRSGPRRRPSPPLHVHGLCSRKPCAAPQIRSGSRP